MAADYDKIFKENIIALLLPLTEKYLGIAIVAEEVLPEKMQVTQEREADFLRKVTTKEQQELILHLEFQSTDSPIMDARMLEYYAIHHKKYSLPIKQFVLYIGRKDIRYMTGKVDTEAIAFRYQMIDIRKFKSAELLESNIPEEILLALLGNYERATGVEVIRKILAKLNEKVLDKSVLVRYLNQLTVLSKLRNLREETVKEINSMPIEIENIEEDYLYKEGRKEGKEEGKEEEKKGLIVRLIKSGKLSLEEIAAIAEVDLHYVQDLSKQVEEDK